MRTTAGKCAVPSCDAYTSVNGGLCWHHFGMLPMSLRFLIRKRDPDGLKRALRYIDNDERQGKLPL